MNEFYSIEMTDQTMTEEDDEDKINISVGEIGGQDTSRDLMPSQPSNAQDGKS